MLDTSPQVHPTGVEHGFNNGVAGMTLLQYYAGQVIGGMAGNLHNTDASSADIAKAWDSAEYLMAEYNNRYGGGE
jgi:hypothetical protein